jgi:hypothetical protein
MKLQVTIYKPYNFVTEATSKEEALQNVINQNIYEIFDIAEAPHTATARTKNNSEKIDIIVNDNVFEQIKYDIKPLTGWKLEIGSFHESWHASQIEAVHRLMEYAYKNLYECYYDEDNDCYDLRNKGGKDFPTATITEIK